MGSGAAIEPLNPATQLAICASLPGPHPDKAFRFIVLVEILGPAPRKRGSVKECHRQTGGPKPSVAWASWLGDSTPCAYVSFVAAPLSIPHALEKDLRGRPVE